MPSRFRPQVGPSTPPPARSGEEIARGIEAFQEGRARAEERERAQEQHEWAREDREHLERQRARDAFHQDLETRDELQARGLRGPLLPRDIERTRDRRRETEPDFPSTVTDAPAEGVGPGTIPSRDPRDLFAQPRPQEEGVGALFAAQAEEGLDAERLPGRRPERGAPAGERRAAVLPGQFVPEHGFADRPVFEDEIRERPPVEERLPDTDRVRIAGREFKQDPARTPEGLAEAESQAMQEEIDRLVAAGVPEHVAPFAARDEVLARQHLGPEDPEEEELPTATADELVELGVDPTAARAGERDPALARQLIRDALQERVETQEDPQITERELLALGFDQDVARAGARDQTLARQLVRDRVREDMAPPELGDDVEERRSNFERRLREHDRLLTEPWQQGIVDRLAGIGPDGREQQPMTPDEIISRFAEQGTPEQTMQQIRDFLRPLTLMGGG